MMDTRICNVCKCPKPLAEFFKNKVRRDGCTIDCKPCSMARHARWVAANLDHAAAYARKRRKEHPEKCRSVDAKRRLDPAFRESQRLSAKKWREEHLEQSRAGGRKWASEHPEEARAKAASYRAAHREQLAEYTREWRKAHPMTKAQQAEKMQRWRKANPEKAKAASAKWQKEHLAQDAAKTRRRKAAKLHATPIWADRAVIDATYTMATAMTKLTGVEYHVDHIVPLKSKLVCGFHVENNLQVIPAVKNMSKGNRHWPDMPQQGVQHG